MESGVTTRWKRRAEEEDGRKRVVGGARLRRRDQDQAVVVVRREKSGRRPVRQVLKRERRGQRWLHPMHQEEEAEPMVVEVDEVKEALEVSGREKDVGAELLLEGRPLEVRR